MRYRIFTIYSRLCKDLKSLKILFIDVVGNFDWLLTPRLAMVSQAAMYSNHYYDITLISSYFQDVASYILCAE